MKTWRKILSWADTRPIEVGDTVKIIASHEMLASIGEDVTATYMAKVQPIIFKVEQVREDTWYSHYRPRSENADGCIDIIPVRKNNTIGRWVIPYKNWQEWIVRID